MMTCCMCYKPIYPRNGGTWVHGSDASPLIVHDKSDPSILTHERCCHSCDDLVLQVRRLQSIPDGLYAAQLAIDMFRFAKNQTEVIVAHMRLIAAFTRSDDE